MTLESIIQSQILKISPDDICRALQHSADFDDQVSMIEAALCRHQEQLAMAEASEDGDAEPSDYIRKVSQSKVNHSKNILAVEFLGINFWSDCQKKYNIDPFKVYIRLLLTHKHIGDEINRTKLPAIIQHSLRAENLKTFYRDQISDYFKLNVISEEYQSDVKHQLQFAYARFVLRDHSAEEKQELITHGITPSKSANELRDDYIREQIPNWKNPALGIYSSYEVLSTEKKSQILNMPLASLKTLDHKAMDHAFNEAILIETQAMLKNAKHYHLSINKLPQFTPFEFERFYYDLLRDAKPLYVIQGDEATQFHELAKEKLGIDTIYQEDMLVISGPSKDNHADQGTIVDILKVLDWTIESDFKSSVFPSIHQALNELRSQLSPVAHSQLFGQQRDSQHKTYTLRKAYQNQHCIELVSRNIAPVLTHEQAHHLIKKLDPDVVEELFLEHDLQKIEYKPGKTEKDLLRAAQKCHVRIEFTDMQIRQIFTDILTYGQHRDYSFLCHNQTNEFNSATLHHSAIYWSGYFPDLTHHVQLLVSNRPLWFSWVNTSAFVGGIVALPLLVFAIWAAYDDNDAYESQYADLRHKYLQSILEHHRLSQEYLNLEAKLPTDVQQNKFSRTIEQLQQMTKNLVFPENWLKPNAPEDENTRFIRVINQLHESLDSIKNDSVEPKQQLTEMIIQLGRHYHFIAWYQHVLTHLMNQTTEKLQNVTDTISSLKSEPGLSETDIAELNATHSNLQQQFDFYHDRLAKQTHLFRHTSLLLTFLQADAFKAFINDPVAHREPAPNSRWEQFAHDHPDIAHFIRTIRDWLHETIMEYKQPVITATVLLLAIGLLATIANPTTMVMQALVIGAIIISIAVGIDSYQRQHRDEHNTQIVTQKEEEAHILKQNVDNLKTAHSACEAMYELTKNFTEAFDSGQTTHIQPDDFNLSRSRIDLSDDPSPPASPQKYDVLRDQLDQAKRADSKSDKAALSDHRQKAPPRALSFYGNENMRPIPEYASFYQSEKSTAEVTDNSEQLII